MVNWQIVMDWLDLADWVLVLAHPLPEFHLQWRIDVGGIHVDAYWVSGGHWEFQVNLQRHMINLLYTQSTAFGMYIR